MITFVWRFLERAGQAQLTLLQERPRTAGGKRARKGMRHIPTPLGLKEGRERLAEFPRGRALRAFIHSSRRSLKASCGPGCPAHWGWRPFKGRGCSHSSKRSRMKAGVARALQEVEESLVVREACRRSSCRSRRRQDEEELARGREGKNSPAGGNLRLGPRHSGTSPGKRRPRREGAAPPSL